MKPTNYLLIPLLILSLVKGDDIFKGKKGSTDWQFESKITSNLDDKLISNNILKYWSGKELGAFFFLNLQSDYDGSKVKKDNITFAGGPRGSKNNFHWKSFVSVDQNYRKKAGFLFTQMLKDGNYDIDGAIVYNNLLPKKFYAGIIAGKRTTEKTITAAGLTYNGLVSGRGMIRYFFSKTASLEFVVDKELKNEKNLKLTFLVKYNLFL